MADNSSDLVVETFKLTKIYQNRQIALNDVTLRLEPGCVLGLLGSNGAGKTTLLRLIIGLHRPTAGWAKVFGNSMTPNAADLRRRIGYIPTNPAVSARHDADHLSRLHGPAVRPARRRAQAAPGLADPRRRSARASGDPIAGFSNGMTARLAVATSLINEPDLLIWDEPTHGLDPEARRSMLELIKTLSREKTLIVSSHNLSDIDEVCNHAAVLSHGQLIYLRLAAGPQGPHAPQSLRAGPRRRTEGDHQGDAGASRAARVQDRSTCGSAGWRLYLQDDAVNTAALANVFMTLTDNKVTLVSIRSVGQQTEQAFLDLVEKEESRGFARLYQADEAA